MAEDKTKAEKKVLIKFKEFAETKPFLNEIRNLRSLVGIPPNGVKPSTEDIKKLHDDARVPDRVLSPLSSVGRCRSACNNPFSIAVNEGLNKIADSLPVKNTYFISLVRGYLFYNNFFYDELEDLLEQANACRLYDIRTESGLYLPTDDPEDQPVSFRAAGIIFKELLEYPIVLRIHTGALLRLTMTKN